MFANPETNVSYLDRNRIIGLHGIWRPWIIRLLYRRLTIFVHVCACWGESASRFMRSRLSHVVDSARLTLGVLALSGILTFFWVVLLSA